MTLAYPYKLASQTEGGFVVQFLDFEEAFTEGDTPEETAFNASEVLSGILAYRLEHGLRIPAPSKRGKHPFVSPNAAV